jgi:hypothetical protein
MFDSGNFLQDPQVWHQYIQILFYDPDLDQGALLGCKFQSRTSSGEKGVDISSNAGGQKGVEIGE